MTCQHVAYVKSGRYATDGEIRTCLDCNHWWVKFPGELRFAEGQTFGPVALRLLTPREDRIELTLLTLVWNPEIWNEQTPVQA